MSLDVSHAYLMAEFRRIDLLIRRQVRRFQAAGRDPAESFRGLLVSDEKANQLAALPFAGRQSAGVNWPVGADDEFSEAMGEAEADIVAWQERARVEGRVLHLVHLASAFDLDRFDVDTLLIALAPSFDARYERLYGYLQDDVTFRRASVNLVLDLLCGPDDDRLERLARFNDSMPLFRHNVLARLVEPPATTAPLLSQTLAPDEAVVSWLLGRYHPNAVLAPHSRLIEPGGSPNDDVLGDDVRELLERDQDEHTVMVLHGPDQALQDECAVHFATIRERPLLRVDLAGATSDLPVLELMRAALRDALLLEAIPLFVGWHHTLVEGHPQPALLAEVAAFPGTLIISGQAPWQARGVERDRSWLWLEFGMPDYGQRRQLWARTLARVAPESNADIEPLAAQFNLTSGQIRDAIMSAHDAAAMRGSAIQTADLFAAARMHSSPALSGQARKINPRYSWSDIVLPDEQMGVLHEIIAAVRGRPLVLGEWGLGSKLTASAGIAILFAGPPGTGKTMAAEVIARELGLELYKIELSSLVSKYIGETEKNLERIFKEAETSNAILFFDEADAIFGKRSEVKDAHDRYANVEVSYLLQRMEAYDGITILATNLRANLDEAFTRRLQFAIDFPFPDDDHRVRIWQTLFPPGVPRDAGVDFAVLARRFRLSGGSIRNIIVSAAYLAAADGGVVRMEHLLHGARRELQKMGRLLRESDLTLDA